MGKRRSPCLRRSPVYDTSLKIFRPVYKECQLSYRATATLIPHRFAGKKVMLKIKGKIIRIFHDRDLIASYEEPEAKHAIVGDPAIYRLLSQDKEQIKRKYGGRKGEQRGVSSRERSTGWRSDRWKRIRASGRCVMEQRPTSDSTQKKPDQAEAHPHA